MKKLVIIRADYNDADYVTSINEINDDELNLIERLTSTIKEKGMFYHNWPDEGGAVRELYSDIFTEEEFDVIDGFMPFTPDWDNIHTIESIRLLEVIDDKNLLW